MDPENQAVCQRILAEFGRTNRELNTHFATRNNGRDQLVRIDREIAAARDREASIVRELTLCRVMRAVPVPGRRAERLRRGIPVIGGVLTCAERVRQLEPELRQVRQRIAQLNDDRMKTEAQINEAERGIHNVTAIRETLQQQRERHACP